MENIRKIKILYLTSWYENEDIVLDKKNLNHSND